MTRSGCRGCGAFRSSGVRPFASLRLAMLRCMVTLAFLFGFVLVARAQDDNVHIEPRTKADPAKTDPTKTGPAVSDSKGVGDAATANSSGKGTGITNEQAFKSHHVAIPVDLVLVNVTVTDDWNRIVTGLG